MQFTGLRLSGFKSFTDPTELKLEPGLTGVIGPNGCGKSNLLEAIRWVMGESSAKSMRGEGMDDVIFAGAATRPPKTFAEVALTVADEAEGEAARRFGADTLEVARRITRDAGSVFRVNGKETRARDVRTLFADAASGPQSPALVRQGRIAELIAAKPQGRRRFLEEAAGVSGLALRRREAELKLKAAEDNLARVSDVIQRLDGQIGSLRRQARQAEKYARLSDEIGETAALLLWLRWQSADREAGEAQAIAEERLRAVAAATAAATAAERAREEGAAALPPLREEGAIAQALVSRVEARRDGLEAEAARAREALARLTTDLARAEADAAREAEVIEDAATALAALEAEAAELSGQGADAATLDAAQAHADDAAGAVRDGEEALDRLAARAAAATAERSAAERAVGQAKGALQSATARLERATPALAETDERLAEAKARLAETRREAEAATGAATDLPARIEEAEAARARLDAEEGEARKALAAARASLDALASERDALSRAVEASRANDMGAAIIGKLRAAPGYEAALAAALGEDAAAPEQEGFSERARGWLALKLLGSRPSVGEPLSAHVEAPAALARRLAVTSVVSRDEGERAQRDLRPGQRLVSPEGDLWLWDGYFAGAEARGSDPAASHLARLNRLDGLKAELTDAEAQAEGAASRADALEKALADARLVEGEARAARRKADDAKAASRRALADAEAGAERLEARHAQLSEDAERAAAQKAEAEAALEAATATLDGLGDPVALREEAEAARVRVGELRAAWTEARAALAELTKGEERRTARLAAIAREREGWEGRRAKAAARGEELATRRAALADERGKVADEPDRLAALKSDLAGEVERAQGRLAAALDALSAAEGEARRTADADRAAAAALAAAREALARAEAVQEGAASRLAETATALVEEVKAEPGEVAERFAAAEIGEVPVATVEQRLVKLRADRDRLGAVNLRAAIEIGEAEAEREALGTERDDLDAAIAKLRRALAELDREGRERLMAAFEVVSRHFAELFTHLFGGGEARLELTESDDPLKAGLEIYCQPPGKRLQALSLLSGGEQTLTALALIFAVFLVNPAPVCVLDEVDAPLDDANVTRFCDLLDEMTRRADARFLIITHHAVTMARMDRLYGVTMMERGVSRLVSVDLSAAVALVDGEQAEAAAPPPRRPARTTAA